MKEFEELFKAAYGGDLAAVRAWHPATTKNKKLQGVEVPVQSTNLGYNISFSSVLEAAFAGKHCTVELAAFLLEHDNPNSTAFTAFNLLRNTAISGEVKAECVILFAHAGGNLLDGSFTDTFANTIADNYGLTQHKKPTLDALTINALILIAVMRGNEKFLKEASQHAASLTPEFIVTYLARIKTTEYRGMAKQMFGYLVTNNIIKADRAAELMRAFERAGCDNALVQHPAALSIAESEKMQSLTAQVLELEKKLSDLSQAAASVVPVVPAATPAATVSNDAGWEDLAKGMSSSNSSSTARINQATSPTSFMQAFNALNSQIRALTERVAALERRPVNAAVPAAGTASVANDNAPTLSVRPTQW